MIDDDHLAERFVVRVKNRVVRMTSLLAIGYIFVGEDGTRIHIHNAKESD